MLRRSGFTLLEAIVSLSVLSIMLAVALPAFRALLDHQRTSSTLSSLVSQASLARLAAVKYRRPTILCPSANGTRCNSDGDWSTGWILFIDHGDRQGPASPSHVLRTEPSPASRHLRVQSWGRNHLRYLPDGRSSGSNLTLRVCTQAGQQLGAVIVNNAGRPRVERGAGGNCR